MSIAQKLESHFQLRPNFATLLGARPWSNCLMSLSLSFYTWKMV